MNKFIVIDGPDRCGKTTQIRKLEKYLIHKGEEVTKCFDPGSTVIGQHIRYTLLHSHYDMCSKTELLLFMASRAQLVNDIIKPAIANNHIILCDRFISATIAYQGALGLSIANIINLGNIAIDNIWPDITIILDVPVHESMNRTSKPDNIESRSIEYHKKVYKLFTQMPNIYPKPTIIIDGTDTINNVHKQIVKCLK